MNRILKSAVLVLVLSMFTPSANAQFWKKINKALDKTEKALDKGLDAVDKGLDTVDKVLPGESTDSIAADSTVTDSVPSAKDFVKDVPNYTLKKIVLTDASGNVLKNEDGTVQSKILVIDKEGKICDRDVAKHHLNQALKSGAMILAKVAATTAGGAALGKKIGGKKGGLIGSLAGVGVGLVTSSGDIKQVKKQISLMKECKKLLAAYEKNFTVEGDLKDATADLKDIEGFDFTALGEVQKSSEDVKKEFAASQEAAGSLDDLDLDTL